MNQNEMRTIKSILRQGKSQLKEAGAGEYQLDAELLLMEAVGCSRIGLYVHNQDAVTEEQAETYEKLLERREKGEPLQYIIGRCEFMALPFSVQPGVLIPRPETELLVEEILDRHPEGRPILALELGTGSGCIAISLAAYRKLARVLAVDVSGQALATARRNAQRNQTAGQIVFFYSDLYQNIPDEFMASLDVIVSNPPYIPKGEIPSLMREVRDYEPELALCGGEDGLYFYRKIVKDAAAYLKAGGMLYLEIGADQGDALFAMLTQAGFCDVEIKKDLAGLPRMAMGMKKY